MTAHSRQWGSAATVALAAWGVAWAVLPAAAAEPEPLPARPYGILVTRHLETPPIDAVPLCVGLDLPPALAEVVRLAVAGDAGQALASLAADESVPELLRAQLAARAAEDRLAIRGARRALGIVLQGEAGARALACGHLEAARLELRLAHYPEAAAQASLARGVAQPGDARDPIAEAARFYRAEALYLAGWSEDAGELYRRLAHSQRPRTAAAARLRLADLDFEAGEAEAALEAYQTLLEQAAAFGADLEDWALRAAEAALASDRYAEAARWTERRLSGQRDGRDAAPVEIRLADIEALSGEPLMARRRLRGVAHQYAGEDLGALADARLVDLGVDDKPLRERLSMLRQAARLGHRGVSIYAQGVLGHELRERGRIDEALSVLTRAAWEPAPERLAPWLVADIDAVLREAATRAQVADDCATYVQRVGGRYGILANHGGDQGLLLDLGGCYEKLGLPANAMRVYRALGRASGGELADRIALPLARTALATGDLGLVRTAAAGHVRRSKGKISEWLLLLAEAEVRDGKQQRAANLLRDLLAQNEPAGRTLQVARAFAQALERLPASSEDLAQLTRVIESTSPDERASDPMEFGEAALLAAEMQRRAGRTKTARRLYAAAAEVLPTGPSRAEAAYWSGALDRDLSTASDTWRVAAGEAPSGPWQRLAAFEAALQPLRSALVAWPSSRSQP